MARGRSRSSCPARVRAVVRGRTSSGAPRREGGELPHRVRDVLRRDPHRVEHLRRLAGSGHVAHCEVHEPRDLAGDVGLRESRENRRARLRPSGPRRHREALGRPQRVHERDGIDGLHGRGVDHAELDRVPQLVGGRHRLADGDARRDHRDPVV